MAQPSRRGRAGEALVDGAVAIAAGDGQGGGVDGGFGPPGVVFESGVRQGDGLVSITTPMLRIPSRAFTESILIPQPAPQHNLDAYVKVSYSG
jgi:hypothetical protein